ncbi:hypothetical protein ACW7N6_38200 [Streptomyces sp. UC1A3]
MEIERRHAPVPGELLDYLRTNPSAAQTAADGGVHVHVHHHYAAPEPAVPAGAVVHQGPQQTVAQKVIPWLYVALLSCIVLTLCALVFAMVAVVAVAVLAAVIVLGLVAAHIINSHAGAVEAKAKAETARSKHRRR